MFVDKASERSIADNFSKHDFRRLLRLNLWSNAEEKNEREKLRAKFKSLVLRPALAMLLTVLGWLLVVNFFLVGVLSSLLVVRIGFVAISLVYAIFLIPTISLRFRRFLGGWGDVVLKAGLVIIALVPLGFTSVIVEKERDRKLQEKQEKIDAMSPEEKYRQFLRDKDDEERRSLAQRKNVEDAEKRESEELQRQALAKQREIDRENEIQRQSEVREANREQGDFYNTLGAPKILYKCRGSGLEKAVGAKVGSVNILLAEAKSDCGSVGYEILRRSD